MGFLGSRRAVLGKGQNAAPVPVTVVLAPDIDTRLAQSAPDNSYATDAELRFRNASGAYQWSLIWPDLSTIVGTITAATLTLYNYSVVATTLTATLYRILPANLGWIEACTWNYADGAGSSDRWAGDVGVAGLDRGSGT